MKPKRMRAVLVAQERNFLGTRNDRLVVTLAAPSSLGLGDGDHAQDHKQKHDEGDADQYLHTGHRGAGKATETEQAGYRGYREKH